jgi:hypothetical protein
LIPFSKVASRSFIMTAIEASNVSLLTCMIMVY